MTNILHNISYRAILGWYTTHYIQYATSILRLIPDKFIKLLVFSCTVPNLKHTNLPHF